MQYVKRFDRHPQVGCRSKRALGGFDEPPRGEQPCVQRGVVCSKIGHSLTVLIGRFGQRLAQLDGRSHHIGGLAAGVNVKIFLWHCRLPVIRSSNERAKILQQNNIFAITLSVL